MLKNLVVVLCILAISGCCGFRLRGYHTVPDYMQQIYITPDEPYQPFQRELRKQLSKNKVKILSQPQTGAATLHLQEPVVNDTTLAYGPSRQIQRYNISVSVTYTLVTHDFKLSRTITRGRELSKSNDLLLSNDSQEQIVKQELIEEVANELLRQIFARPHNNAALLDSPVIDDNPC